MFLRPNTKSNTILYYYDYKHHTPLSYSHGWYVGLRSPRLELFQLTTFNLFHRSYHSVDDYRIASGIRFMFVEWHKYEKKDTVHDKDNEI